MKKTQKITAGICTALFLGASSTNILSPSNTQGIEPIDKNVSNFNYEVNAKTSNKKMITTSNLNVRSGPSTKYKTLGTLKKGETITITSTSGDWAKFTYKGKTAYASTKYLKTAPSTNTTSTRMKTTSSLNVRSGPSTKYKILGKLKKGEAITINSTSDNWAKFTYKGKTAYVSTKYLQKVTSSNNNNNNNNNNISYPIAENVTSSKIGVKKFIRDCYIREGTSEDSKIIGIGKKGNMIEYVDLVKTGVHKVVFNGKYGYIVSDPKIDVLETGVFGNLNSNTTNKYVKDFNLLANKIFEKDGWFWRDTDFLSYRYGLVNLAPHYNKNTLSVVNTYIGKIDSNQAKMRKEALLEVLKTIFGDKNALNVYNDIFNNDYVYLRKTYNGVHIEIEKTDYIATIYF